MDLTKYKGMKGIGSFLERFKSIENTPPNTLFDIEPSWEKLKEHRCPICGNKLIFPQRKSIALCYGKSHGDKKSFVIKNQKLAQILAR